MLKNPEKRIANLDRYYRAPAVALSQVRWTDGGRRTIHSRTTPTPFSTATGHGCMRSLAHTPRRTSERLAEVCLRYHRTSSSCPRQGSLPPSPRLCTGAPAATPAALTTAVNLDTPRHTPFNLHKSRVHRASGFLLTTFSNATPHTFLQSQALFAASRPKKH